MLRRISPGYSRISEYIWLSVAPPIGLGLNPPAVLREGRTLSHPEGPAQIQARRCGMLLPSKGRQHSHSSLGVAAQVEYLDFATCGIKGAA